MTHDERLPPTYARDFWMFLGDTSLAEKRDEGLVGGLDQHKLEWVSIEGNALQGTKDCVEDCSSGDYTRQIQQDGFFTSHRTYYCQYR